MVPILAREKRDECDDRPAVDGKPKLLDRVSNALRVRHLARSTEKTYVYWCRRYILYHNKRHPLDMGKQEVEAFLTHLSTVEAPS